MLLHGLPLPRGCTSGLGCKAVSYAGMTGPTAGIGCLAHELKGTAPVLS